jgi:phenylacetic acid degradation operon negative regulatory protein
VHVCPLDRTEELGQLLPALGLADQVAVFRGRVPSSIGLADRDLVQAMSGDLDGLERAWRTFLRRFRPLAEAVAGDRGGVDGQTAFLTRTLLVHAYRRIVLREPELPGELWPPAWPGETAYEVAACCYHALAAGADAHLARICDIAGAALPAIDRAYAGRYPPAADRHRGAG